VREDLFIIGRNCDFLATNKNIFDNIRSKRYSNEVFAVYIHRVRGSGGGGGGVTRGKA
jgi:hypothetical protein